jgi:hypothetical protein
MMDDTITEVRALAAEGILDERDTAGIAIGRLMALLRAWPDLPRWESRLSVCLREAGIRLHLDGHKARKQEAVLDRLIEMAQDNLVSDHELLAMQRERVLALDLTEWQRLIYSEISGQAMDAGPYGGPNVLMSHAMLQDRLQDKYGRRPGLQTITAAREKLTSLGAWEVTVGTRGKSATGKASVYHILPDSARAELTACARAPEIRCFPRSDLTEYTQRARGVYSVPRWVYSEPGWSLQTQAAIAELLTEDEREDVVESEGTPTQEAGSDGRGHGEVGHGEGGGRQEATARDRAGCAPGPAPGIVPVLPRAVLPWRSDLPGQPGRDQVGSQQLHGHSPDDGRRAG